MKVKIGDKIYDSEKEPIMLVLDNDDKEFISSMDIKDKKYCSFPDGYDTSKILDFMKEV